MTSAEAKNLFFRYWQYVKYLVKRRFSHDEAIRDNALDYVIEKSRENTWRRVRAYSGKGTFQAFITALKSLAGKLREQFKSSAEEALLLRMVYYDGLSVSEAGRRLYPYLQKKEAVNKAGGQHRRILERLRMAMEQTELAGELRLLLE
ncbi:MAG: hypothetical protein GY862_37960 [Gammaproteobacteria bacterium]|nr:hypothetical protein [Gammaproteobacteria bacterium]